jgi:hypothetical protein
MAKKQYLLALAAFLFIPAVAIVGGVLFDLINPEIAAGHPNYERNWRWLQLARSSFFFGAMLLNIALWFVTCALVLASKRRTQWWLVLAVLGPLGFAVLAALRDHDPAPQDLYERFARRLAGLLRLGYELCAFVAISVLAYEAMITKRELMIWREAVATGVSRAQIIAQQNASSGMWAFGEMLVILYFGVLLYLLRPIFVNLAGQLIRARKLPTRV